MATLILAIGACLSRMTGGEKRFAQRPEEKLEDDYLCWYDVSIGERTRHPNFIVFHPSRGLLVLEFPLVCILGIGAAASLEEPIEDEARLLYVAMTRATNDLVMTHEEASLLV